MKLKWSDAVARWLPLVEEMERLGFEDYAVPEIYRSAEAHIAQLEAENEILREGYIRAYNTGQFPLITALLQDQSHE